ncbi:MAG: hypothetical protein QM680_07235 [Luteolibacter sp.]
MKPELLSPDLAGGIQFFQSVAAAMRTLTRGMMRIQLRHNRRDTIQLLWHIGPSQFMLTERSEETWEGYVVERVGPNPQDGRPAHLRPFIAFDEAPHLVARYALFVSLSWQPPDFLADDSFIIDPPTDEWSYPEAGE